MQEEDPHEVIKQEEETEVIHISHNQCRGSYTFGLKTKKSPQGELRKVNRNTINASRVSDATTALSQNAFDLKEVLNLEQIKAEATKRTKEYMEKYDLDKTEGIDSKEINYNKRIEKTILENNIHEITKRKLVGKNIIHVPFDVFVQKINIKSVMRAGKEGKARVGKVIELIEKVQDDAVVNSKIAIVEIDEDTGRPVIREDISKMNLVPKITFTIEEGSFRDINDLKTSSKKNKEKYIKSVKIEFDMETYVDVIVPRTYIEGKKENRQKFSTIYSHSFDSWMRYLYSVQLEYGNKQYFTFRDLAEKWNLNYKNYNDLKRSVLEPAIRDFNTNVDLQVKMHEKFGTNRQFEHAYFEITRRGLPEKIEERNYLDLAYFITTQHLNTKEYIDEEFQDFKTEWDYRKVCTNNMEKYGEIKYSADSDTDLTFNQWRETHKESIKAFEEMIIAEEINESWFTNKNIYLCRKRLALIDKKTNEIKKLYGGKVTLSSPALALDYYKNTTEGN